MGYPHETLAPKNVHCQRTMRCAGAARDRPSGNLERRGGDDQLGVYMSGRRSARLGCYRLIGKFLLEVLPVAVEAIRVTCRWLGRLRFEPANSALASVVEGVNATDAGPEQITAA